MKTRLISVVLYPQAAAAAICGNRVSEEAGAGGRASGGRKEGRGGEISEAFGLAECEIVSGEKDFGDWHSCVARAHLRKTEGERIGKA